jgi:hypothetical protein
MEKTTIRNQLRENFIAIVSLVIAIIALVYSAWREETTEKHRNIRTAGFEVLMNLGELQIVVNHVYYKPDDTLANPYVGWGYLALASDLSNLLPSPVPEMVAKLVNVWGENWENIHSNEEAINKISNEIDNSRKEVLQVLRHLK